MALNIKDEKTREEYVNKYFTSVGCKAVFNFTQNLVRLYFRLKEEDYPFVIPFVFGFPIFDYSSKVNSKEELLGRIKAYCQVLGLSELKYKNENVLGGDKK